MSQHQHFTTRRAFIATFGFGGLGLYGAWAAYGAAPLPFVFSADHAVTADPRQAEPAQGHGGHGGSGAMDPEEFLRRHGEFVERFKQPDGSVAPGHPGAHAAPSPGKPAAPAGQHDAHDAPRQGDLVAGVRPGSDHAGHGSAAAGSGAAAPVDIYLLAFRFGFDPDEFRLEAGRPYRFRMMASDVAHGASLQLGGGSRIIRVRPNVVTDQTITFLRPGSFLVYCTVFCGPAHDAMKGRIIVA